MKILSISTSSNIATASITDDNKCILELNINNNKTHSETLMPLIDNLLKSTNLALSDINAIACDVGPRFIYWNKNWNINNKSICSILKYSCNSCFFATSFGI